MQVEVDVSASDYWAFVRALFWSRKPSRSGSGTLRRWLKLLALWLAAAFVSFTFLDCTGPHSRLDVAIAIFPFVGGETPERRWIGKALRSEWKRAADSIGVKVRLYEGTKHSSATAARRRGVPLEAIQAALGHSDSRSTERYARLAPQVSSSVLRPRSKG